jgi:hypothetical protein
LDFFHSMLGVGRSMFDVHLLKQVPYKRGLWPLRPLDGKPLNPRTNIKKSRGAATPAFSSGKNFVR